VIKVVCAYCGEVYGAKDDGREAVSVLHGVCKVCYPIEIKKIEAMATLDKLKIDEEHERITRAA
jgi:hypothetical protein